MRIVITGASGNVGTALLRRLAREPGRHELVGICRRPPVSGQPYDVATWKVLDLSQPGVETALAGVVRGADAVVHLAWGFQPSHDVAYLRRLGVGGTAAVLAAVQAEGVPHLVHMSSVGAYSAARPGVRVTEHWPTDGIPSLQYSVDKAAAERLVDDHERCHPDGTAVARMRPGLIVQRDAGSALLRYGFPAYLPAAVLRHLPLLPLDRALVVPVVHTDDVAEAVALALEARATGAFNVAAEPPVTRDRIAEVLGARPLHLPAPLLRAAAALTWHLRLQPLDPGWLDLAFSAPELDTGRIRRELGWRPEVDARTALADAVRGMADAAATTSPALRPRSVAEEITALVRRGPIEHRPRP